MSCKHGSRDEEELLQQIMPLVQNNTNVWNKMVGIEEFVDYETWKQSKAKQSKTKQNVVAFWLYIIFQRVYDTSELRYPLVDGCRIDVM